MAISPEKRKQILKDVRQLVLMAAIILTGRSVLADWYVVPTGSMKPTILEGDRVFVWKSAYQIRVPFSKIRIMTTGEPRRGDVVVVRNPDGGSVPFVKRLIGLPGDVVELRNEALLVNGKPQKVEYLEPLTLPDGDIEILGTERIDGRTHPIRILPERHALRNFGPITVPEDEVFLMGDNRDESRDARFFGTRPVVDLLGRAVGVMWSWSPARADGSALSRLGRPRFSRFGRAFITSAPAARE
ncbi:MAG TPA: signal peptidase I [Thermoanaerobaculia bacterium]|jgi:signal peptidase I|nr:signal peptidase I [Thermoanaerobaculia bacterium]HPA52742.1 signal peptidase I [Thermoanaerobaculia bacterium]HQN08184.1 signal peptidase I [Thermoanaerobaculia bacterium]HQP85873.1 signal peptidase I [Thermoanaerobaculia bacterium]